MPDILPLEPSENLLLAALPPEDYQRLLPNLEVLQMEIKHILYDVNKPIEYVYFPLRGMASMLAVLKDGILVEVGTVGNEGMVGIPVFLGTIETSIMSLWQVAGSAARMKADVFQAEIKQGGPLVAILHRYIQALFVMLAQHTACNRIHTIHQRAARWILMTQDRAYATQFGLTQEFLSQMLGVRRAGVNEVMRSFQNMGILRYQRGVITILNRKGLEDTVCECYGTIKNEYDRMFD
jgi:CRP-like cAMP-binding protein